MIENNYFFEKLVPLFFFVIITTGVLMAFFQNMLYKHLRKFHCVFLDNLTDGNSSKGLRGNPIKGFRFLFGNELDSDEHIRRFKLGLRISLFAFLSVLVSLICLLFIILSRPLS
jgi:hypothetical protein